MGPTRLRLYGDVDEVAAAGLRDAVREVLLTTPGPVELDLERVRFLDAAGITALLHCRADAGRAGAGLTLSNPQPLVHRVLQIVGLLELFGLPARQPVPAPMRQAA